MDTLKVKIKGTLYNNMEIGTLAADGWSVTFGTAMRGLGGLRPHPVPSLKILMYFIGRCTYFEIILLYRIRELSLHGHAELNPRPIVVDFAAAAACCG